MFGTFTEERDDDPVRFGLIENIKTHNPLRIAFREWVALFRDVGQLKDWIGRRLEWFDRAVEGLR